MLTLLVSLATSQATTVKVCDPAVQSNCVTTTQSALKRGLDVIIVDGGVRIVGPVAVTGPISVNILDAGPPINVQGPLTDAQLRAAGVAVTGPISVNILDAGSPINVQGPLTDTQLRAATVPISGTVTVGAFPDNEPVNVAQMNGVAVTMGNGVAGTGVQRVAIASDNTAFSVNVGTFPDNEPINVAQMNGVAVTMGNGVSGTGVQRVTLASDTSGVLSVTPQKRAAAALTQAISCATSATALPASPLASRVSVCVTNVGASTVYVGHASVTTSTGTPLAAQSGSTPGGSFCDDLGSQPLFCIVASGTVEVRLLEN